MSTLAISKVRFFMLAVNILVIALTVKSASAFESKSDKLRQALRHREQLDTAIINSLPSDLLQRMAENNLSQETIPLSVKKIDEKSTGSFQSLEVAFEQALKWIEVNKDKRADTISIVGLSESQKKTPIVNDKSFLPATLVIFYKKLNEKTK